jgi:hypothetical protein
MFLRLLATLPLAGALVSPGASGVSLSSDDAGQVVLLPFYSVRSGFVTSLSIVNRNQHHAKAIKVRFREGKIGAPALDLNVFLGARDSWSASLVDDGTAAMLSVSDQSCTSPAVPSEGIPFSNRYYTGQVAGTYDDGGGASLDRTREGYVEIIEMGVIANGADLVASSPATPVGNTVAIAVRSASTGVPANCSTVRVSNLFPGPGDLRAPTGEISASAILIQGSTGSEFVIPPVALQRFFVPANPNDDLYAEPGSLYPDLTNVQPARSDVWSTGRDGPVVLTVDDWVAAGGKPIDAVSAVLMKGSFSAGYDISSPQIRSEMVITMPTMRYYVTRENPNNTFFVPRGPFLGQFISPSNGQVPNDNSACSHVHSFPSNKEAAPYTAPPLYQIPPGLNVRAVICRAANRVAIVPSGAAVSVQSVFGSHPEVIGLELPPGSTFLGVPLFSAGVLMLTPSTRTAEAIAAGPGQHSLVGSNPISGQPIPVSTMHASGGLGGIAPQHSDGISRRYRGLPIIGFVAVQATLGGQGYGGMFRLQGSANPAP